MRKTIETKRLILRPFEIEDAEAMFYGWASDKDVTKYLTWNPHKTIDETKEILNKWILEYQKPERLNFGIVLKEDNKLIGGIDVVGYFNGVNGIPVIGYALSKNYWNHGYMTEACQALIDYLFSQGYSEIFIDAVKDNISSNKVIQKCGGEFIKAEYKEFVNRNKTFLVNSYVIKRK